MNLQTRPMILAVAIGERFNMRNKTPKSQEDIMNEIDCSVWLSDYGDGKIRMFFCPNCQAPLLQYKGKIVAIVPGFTPSPLPMIRKCDGCKMKYSFNGIVEFTKI